MSAPKTHNAWGMMAKPEATYGNPEALGGANDGILLADMPDFDFDQWLFDGARVRSPGGGGIASVPKAGQFGTMTLPVDAIGAAAAYSASVLPNMRTLLRACGLDQVVDTTGGSEKVTYSMEIGPTGLDSLTCEGYKAGQKYPLSGAYGTFEVGAEGPVIPRWVFTLMGIVTAPVSDAAIPAITYPATTILPPIFDKTQAVIGSWAVPVIRGFNFTLNRSHDTPRADAWHTAGSHRGFTPGLYDPTLELTVERVALATFNPYSIRDAGTLIRAELNVGSVQYNRWKLGGGSSGQSATAQIVSVEDAEDGPASTWVLTLKYRPTSYIAHDGFIIRFD